MTAPDPTAPAEHPTAGPGEDPGAARRCWQAVEPLHAMVYFAPEPQEEFAALGLDVKGNRAVGYFPGRAAALGAVTPGVVTALFHGFSPLAVLFGLQGVWEQVTPEQVQQARWRGAARALRRMLGDAADGPEVQELAGLLRRAAESARCDGRALAAANQALPYPEDPLLELFHAQTVLREHRGDGHVAALVHAGLTGLEALVLHVAVGDSWSRKGLQSTRAWSDEQWDAAVAGLVERGQLQPDGSFTEEGRAARAALEAETDRLAAQPYAVLGEQGCSRLQELGRPLSRAVLDAGGLGVR